MHVAYFLMATTVGAWALSHWLLQISFSKGVWDPLFLGKLTFAIGCFVAPSYVLFTLVFPTSDKWSKKIRTPLLYLPAVICLPFSLTDFFVTSISKKPWGFDWSFNESGFFIFGVYMISYVSMGFYVLVRKFLESKGLAKLQIKYMLSSTALISAFIAMSNIILPFFGNDKLVPYGPASTLLLFGATAYTILRYRLLDIEVIISKIVLFSSTIFIVFVFHVSFVYIVRPLIGYDAASMISLGVIFLVLLFTPLSAKAQDIIDTLIYGGRYDYRQVLKESAKALVTILDLDTLLDHFIDIIVKNIGVGKAALFLYNPDFSRYEISVAHGFDKEERNGPALNEDSGIIGWVKEHRSIFIKQAVEQGMPEGMFATMYAGLKAIDTEVLIPMFYKEKLLGLLSLDNKASGGAYSGADLDILETIALEASIAIENARLFGESITDGLTGLFHHKYFKQRLKDEFEWFRRYKQPVSLLMIDVDHFKDFNDRYGHQVGDKALKDICGILKKDLRAIDIPARYGGEELAIIVPHGAAAGEAAAEDSRKFAQGLAERLRKKVENMAFEHNGEKLNTTISIGVATADSLREVSSAEELIKLADTALYKAKNAGRNRVETA